MTIRKANINDAKGILQIRNNSEINKFFKDTNEISLEKHIIWLKKYLNNTKNLFLVYINQINGKVIGYIRKDFIDNNKFEISIAIDINFQKKGIASKLLLNLLNKTKNSEILYAEIYKNNIKSVKFFKKNEFKNYSEKKDIILLSYTNE